MQFMVHWNGGAVFVKERGFFLEQKAQNPTWTGSSAWVGPIQADGIEHARLIGQNMVNAGEIDRNGRVK